MEGTNLAANIYMYMYNVHSKYANHKMLIHLYLCVTILLTNNTIALLHNFDFD